MAADPGLASLGSSLVSLTVILALLGGAAYAAKRLRIGAGTAKAGGARIEILAARQIGWQCSLLIVEAEGRRFLIGAGRHGLTSIGALDGAGPAPKGETVV